MNKVKILLIWFVGLSFIIAFSVTKAESFDPEVVAHIGRAISEQKLMNSDGREDQVEQAVFVSSSLQGIVESGKEDIGVINGVSALSSQRVSEIDMGFSKIQYTFSDNSSRPLTREVLLKPSLMGGTLGDVKYTDTLNGKTWNPISREVTISPSWNGTSIGSVKYMDTFNTNWKTYDSSIREVSILPSWNGISIGGVKYTDTVNRGIYKPSIREVSISPSWKGESIVNVKYTDKVNINGRAYEPYNREVSIGPSWCNVRYGDTYQNRSYNPSTKTIQIGNIQVHQTYNGGSYKFSHITLQ